MRRVIEAVVNTHVFNSQRQQYKQRKHSVSEFHHYTKLVRLEPAEATTLRDLYAKLSITEHDDARNACVNTDRLLFRTVTTVSWPLRRLSYLGDNKKPEGTIELCPTPAQRTSL